MTLFLLLFLLIPGDEKSIIREFGEWARTYKGSLAPTVMKANYGEALASRGLAPAEIEVRLATLERVMRDSPAELMKVHFDVIYTSRPELFQAAPNEFLAKMIEGRTPGKALDVAMGQGRNSLLLARKGWDVTGYDVSAAGLGLARERADREGLKITAVEASHGDFNLGEDRWDLIVLTYSLLSFGDPAVVDRLHRGLKKGGVIVVEQPLSGGTGKGPVNALLGSFCTKFRILHYEDLVATADWSRQPMRLGRVLAEKE